MILEIQLKLCTLVPRSAQLMFFDLQAFSRRHLSGIPQRLTLLQHSLKGGFAYIRLPVSSINLFSSDTVWPSFSNRLSPDVSLCLICLHHAFVSVLGACFMLVPVSCLTRILSRQKWMYYWIFQVNTIKVNFKADPIAPPSLSLSLQVFKLKAVQLAEKLLPAFNTPTGIPWAMVNLKRSVTLPLKTLTWDE